MPESPFKHLHEKYNERVKGVPFQSSHPYIDINILDTGKELFTGAYEAAIVHYDAVNHDREEALKHANSNYKHLILDKWNDNSLNLHSSNWTSTLGKLLKAHESMRATIKYYEDADGYINRFDRDAHARTLIFRIMTTASIAFLVGTLYTIAGNFDKIYLPLQHKTVIHYYDGKPHKTPPPADLYEKTKTEVEVTGANKSVPLKVSIPIPKT